MEFLTLKHITGIIAIALTFIAYAPYVRDVVQRKTKPHIFSWFIWAIVTAIIYTLQVSAGAGLGSVVTLAVAVISVLIFILGFNHGNTVIKKIDILFLALAMLAIPLWLVIGQPVLSIILLCTIDLLGFAPTVRKSWHQPYSETLSFYSITTFRHALSLVALVQYNIVTMLFPSIWVIANALFAIMLIIRRKTISH